MRRVRAGSRGWFHRCSLLASFARLLRRSPASISKSGDVSILILVNRYFFFFFALVAVKEARSRTTARARSEAGQEAFGLSGTGMLAVRPERPVLLGLKSDRTIIAGDKISRRLARGFPSLLLSVVATLHRVARVTNVTLARLPPSSSVSWSSSRCFFVVPARK